MIITNICGSFQASQRSANWPTRLEHHTGASNHQQWQFRTRSSSPDLLKNWLWQFLFLGCRCSGWEYISTHSRCYHCIYPCAAWLYYPSRMIVDNLVTPVTELHPLSIKTTLTVSVKVARYSIRLVSQNRRGPMWWAWARYMKSICRVPSDISDATSSTRWAAWNMLLAEMRISRIAWENDS